MQLYYEKVTDYQICLSFGASDGKVGFGIIIPLNVLGTEESERILADLSKKLEVSVGKAPVKMTVRTNNFSVPGIGSERTFWLKFEVLSKPKTSEEFPVVQHKLILDFLLAIRKCGRPLTPELMFDEKQCERNELWSKFPVQHLLCRWTESLPLIDDTKIGCDAFGIYDFEKRGTIFGLSTTVTARAPKIQFVKKCEADTDTPPVSVSVVSDHVPNKKNSSAAGISPESQAPLTSGFIGVTVGSSKSVDVARNFSVVPKKEQKSSPVLDNVKIESVGKNLAANKLPYKLISQAPTKVVEYLSNHTFQGKLAGDIIGMNIHFALAMAEWSEMPLGEVCRLWCSENGIEGKTLEKTVIRFRCLPMNIQSLVLSLDHFFAKPPLRVSCLNPKTNRVDGCKLCSITHIHETNNCPLYYTFLMRDPQWFMVGRCSGCTEKFCLGGRRHHNGITCATCQQKDHVYDACDSEMFWKSDDRNPIHRQLAIIAAFGSASEGELNILLCEYRSARDLLSAHRSG